jgi:hypothetical protein
MSETESIIADIIAGHDDFVRTWNEHVELCRRRVEVNDTTYLEALTDEERCASEFVGTDGVAFVRRFRTRETAPWLECWA